MKIDIHNYQPWLTLYLDDELTAEEKKEVEKFLHTYPEIGAELDALYMTRQIPDRSLAYPDKERLYKNISAETFITPQNRQELFSLYHDNELSNEERKKVEVFIAAHPAFKDEFIASGSLRMVPDPATTFPSIQTLYRPQRADRVVYMNRWAMAAAASILFILSLQGYRYFLDTPPSHERSVTIAKPDISSVLSLKKPIEAALVMSENSNKPTPVRITNYSNAFPKKETIVSDKIPVAYSSNEVQTPVAAAATESIPDSHTADIAITLPSTDLSASYPQEPVSSFQQTAGVQMENNSIIPTSYTENMDTSMEEDESKGNSVLRRNTGMKVFIRKINRAMERISVHENNREKHKTMVRIASIKFGME